MEEEQEKLPVVEKQMFGANGVAFTILTKDPKDNWKTGYAYYLSQRAAGLPLRPLIGRYSGENKDEFQVYNGEVKAWESKDFWDYSQPVVDGDGNAVKNAAGRARIKPFFEQKFDWLLEYDTPVAIQYWNSEEKKSVTTTATKFYLRVSKNLSQKFMDEVQDERNGENAKFTLDYDSNKTPAEQYKVRYTRV